MHIFPFPLLLNSRKSVFFLIRHEVKENHMILPWHVTNALCVFVVVEEEEKKKEEGKNC